MFQQKRAEHSVYKARRRIASKYLGQFDRFVEHHGDRHIGRIFLHAQAPAGRPWFWSIAAGEAKSSIFNKGYSASREQAMADFKAQWIKRGIGT